MEVNSVASTTTCVMALTNYSKNGRCERKVVLSKNLMVKNHSRIDAIAARKEQPPSYLLLISNSTLARIFWSEQT
ncbi:MAG: hypothetical protein WA220_05870 [Candidatus Nitrosopolaris sp.]